MQHRSIIALTFQMCPPSLQWITHPPLLLRLECPCSKSPVYKGPNLQYTFFLLKMTSPTPPLVPYHWPDVSVTHPPLLLRRQCCQTARVKDSNSENALQLGKKPRTAWRDTFFLKFTPLYMERICSECNVNDKQREATAKEKTNFAFCLFKSTFIAL